MTCEFLFAEVATHKILQAAHAFERFVARRPQVGRDLDQECQRRNESTELKQSWSGDRRNYTEDGDNGNKRN